MFRDNWQITSTSPTCPSEFIILASWRIFLLFLIVIFIGLNIYKRMPDHGCCLRGLVCCLRHGQQQTPPQQGARDDWRRTPDRSDTHHAGKQTLLRGAEEEEEPLATTTKRTTTGKCTGTDVVQHLYQRPARTSRHSQLHLRRRIMHRVARKRLKQHRRVTHAALNTMATYCDTNQLRANPSKTQVCAFHLRNREAKRELNVVCNGTRLSNTPTTVYLGVHLDRTFSSHVSLCQG